MVQFFPDGTAVATVTYADNTGSNYIESFTWVFSADGKTLKTETPSRLSLGIQVGGPLVAHIVVLTNKELRIDEPSSAHGLFQRIE